MINSSAIVWCRLRELKTEEEVYDALTEYEINEVSKEVFEYCEFIRQELADKADPKSWQNVLRSADEYYCSLKDGANGVNEQTEITNEGEH